MSDIPPLSPTAAAAAQAASGHGAPAGGLTASLQSLLRWTSAVPAAPAPAEGAQPASLAARVACLLARLLAAAATSGSSIAELTAAGSGLPQQLPATGSSGSLQSMASARSSNSDLFGSACSDVDSAGWEAAAEP